MKCDSCSITFVRTGWRLPNANVCSLACREDWMRSNGRYDCHSQPLACHSQHPRNSDPKPVAEDVFVNVSRDVAYLFCSESCFRANVCRECYHIRTKCVCTHGLFVPVSFGEPGCRVCSRVLSDGRVTCSATCSDWAICSECDTSTNIKITPTLLRELSASPPCHRCREEDTPTPISYNEQLVRVRENGLELVNVPEAMKTYEMCREAMKQNGLALEYVPHTLATKDMCLEAVKKNGIPALKHVPVRLLEQVTSVLGLTHAPATRDAYLTAVEIDGLNIRYVPADHLTVKLCLEAVKKNGLALSDIPSCHITGTVYMAAVKQNGLALQYVSVERSPGCSSSWYSEVCLEAVKQNGLALHYVRGDSRSIDICREAVKQNPVALEYVPIGVRRMIEDMTVTDDESSSSSSESDSEDEYHSLNDVPLLKRISLTCLAFVRKNGLDIRYVPSPILSRDLCREAVKQNGLALQYVSSEHRTLDVCREAVKQNADAMKYVDHDRRSIIRDSDDDVMPPLEDVSDSDDDDMPPLADEWQTNFWCLKAVKKNGLVLTHVPLSMRSYDVCMAAVRQNGLAIQYVPTDRLWIAICMEAVKQNGMALQHVPLEYKTKDICEEAVKQNADAISYVPHSLRTLGVLRPVATGLRTPSAGVTAPTSNDTWDKLNRQMADLNAIIEKATERSDTIAETIRTTARAMNPPMTLDMAIEQKNIPAVQAMLHAIPDGEELPITKALTSTTEILRLVLAAIDFEDSQSDIVEEITLRVPDDHVELLLQELSSDQLREVFDEALDKNERLVYLMLKWHPNESRITRERLFTVIRSGNINLTRRLLEVYPSLKSVINEAPVAYLSDKVGIQMLLMFAEMDLYGSVPGSLSEWAGKLYYWRGIWLNDVALLKAVCSLKQSGEVMKCFLCNMNYDGARKILASGAKVDLEWFNSLQQSTRELFCKELCIPMKPTVSLPASSSAEVYTLKRRAVAERNLFNAIKHSDVTLVRDIVNNPHTQAVINNVLPFAVVMGNQLIVRLLLEKMPRQEVTAPVKEHLIALATNSSVIELIKCV